jgi:hypothetical protein
MVLLGGAEGKIDEGPEGSRVRGVQPGTLMTMGYTF